MTRRVISRADLLRAYYEHDTELPGEIARRLGYEWDQRREPRPKETAPRFGEFNIGPDVIIGKDEVKPATKHEPLTDTPFWLPTHYAREIMERDESQDEELRKQGMPSRPRRRPPPYQPLADFNALVPRLRTGLGKRRLTRAIDLPRVVDRVSRAQPLNDLPRARRKGWGSRLIVLEDRSFHLAPYFTDQIEAAARLADFYADSGYQPALFSELWEAPVFMHLDGRSEPFNLRPGDQLLVLGDLGALAPRGGDSTVWRRMGEQCHDLGVPALVLMPCHRDLCSPALRNLYSILSWEHPAPLPLADDQLELRGGRLLDLLSLTPLLEPGLLRDIRLSLGAARYPAELEAWVWTHPAVLGGRGVTALDSEEFEERRQRLFDNEPDETHATVLRHVRDWLGARAYELWLETVLNLDLSASEAWRELLQPLMGEGDREESRRLLPYLAQRLEDRSRPLPEHSRSYVHGLAIRAARELDGDSEQARALWRIRADQDRPPGSHDPENQTIRRLSIVQSPSGLRTREHRPNAGAGGLVSSSPVALMETRDGRLELCEAVGVPEVKEKLPERPDWASAIGVDRFGPWCEFEVEDVVQRLRWIEAGEFMMGSSEDEVEGYGDEEPRHAVRIDKGFWLFDTPVTQALWQAVMGSNPSNFVSPGRPVEQVSWNDANEFAAVLNFLLPGIELSLPSEAQWEYACRAGTEGAIYSGELEILGERNAPALDDIAWYGGNSGNGFELANGWDTSDWSEQQYPNDRAGTHPVMGKQANAWGLYDVLGNVWEWVRDVWHNDYQGAPVDAGAWEAGADEKSPRVLRGGSWLDHPRRVRCACRSGYGPATRSIGIGFRLARVQGELKQQGAQADGPGEQVAERTAHTGGRAGAGAILDSSMVTPMGESGLSLPSRPDNHSGMVLRTDLERLTFTRVYRREHPWMKALGRDRFGAWTEFEYEGVRQRMRWIPPGRFTMGSPNDEPGRSDAEGPLREVIISGGFWLFDTSVTQALWQAVMGTNPSRFVSPDRPVEQVSWHEAADFASKLNRGLPGIELQLPSEAQWEYACRAGTESALYSGGIEILGDANALALEPIARYGGNSAVGFELDNGYELDWLTDRKHPDASRSGTHPVRGKQANAWGLYDMLGNVWEWVQDEWHDYYEGAPGDGEAWEGSDGALRVLRGGSWNDHARFVRCACRDHHGPGYRDDALGFRLARVHGELKQEGAQADGPGEQVAERTAHTGGRAGAGPDKGLAALLRGFLKRGKD